MRRKQKIWFNGAKFNTQTQVDAFVRIQKANISNWPNEVRENVINKTKQFGWSGDLLYQCLYEWVLENVK